MSITPGYYTVKEPDEITRSPSRHLAWNNYTNSVQFDNKSTFISYQRTCGRYTYRGPKVKGAEHLFNVWSQEMQANPETVTRNSSMYNETITGPASKLFTYNAFTIKHPDPNKLRNDAILRCRQRLAEVSTNSAVSIAEFGQTVDLVTKTATTLAKAYSDLRKGRIQHVLRGLNMTSGSLMGPANAWLSYRYGWLPLLSDVESHMKQLAKVLEREYPMVRASATIKGSSNDVSPGPVDSTVRLYRSICNISVRVTVEAEIVSQSLKRLNETGLLNPLLVAWELVPLSFVADWFLPIGDYLEDMSRTAGLKFKKGFITDKYVRVDTFSDTTTTWKNHGREILTSFPTATFSIANGMNITRMADAIALLGTAMKVTRDRVY